MKNRIASAALGAFLAATAMTPTLAGKPAEGAAELQKSLQSRFPNVKIESLRAITEIPGLYELVTASEIAYVDGTGNFLISGRLMDTRTRENLTQARWDSLHAIDFYALPFDRAIKTVRGDGSRKLAVFADPDCPFCQQLEKELKDVDNVTIYTFLFPLQIHKDAFNKSVKVWCSPDRSKVWASWMINRDPIESGTCEQNVIEQNMKLGEELKVVETPTIFLANGQRFAGALPRDQIEAKLAAK